MVLLGAPRIFLILEVLNRGPLERRELRRRVGFPAQSTLRSHLGALKSIGAIEQQREDSFPGAIEYSLLQPGRELLLAAASLQAWLDHAPHGELRLGEDPARAAIKALAGGWSSSVISALAAEPHSLTELDNLIEAVNYPTIERRLDAMAVAGLVEPVRSGQGGTRYLLTGWVRTGVAPLAAASRWESLNPQSHIAPASRIDLEAALLLCAPLLALPGRGRRGSCRLELNPGDARKRKRPEMVLEIAAEEIAVRPPGAKDLVDAWATGTTAAWFAALIDGDSSEIEFGGSDLGREVVAALHAGSSPPALHLRSLTDAFLDRAGAQPQHPVASGRQLHAPANDRQRLIRLSR